ncbi:hypothetical protein Avbf_18877 [Armadillidium vulgare]|nr:hypothetical protein Avbf_18877 [Armadillidium vulgare]
MYKLKFYNILGEMCLLIGINLQFFPFQWTTKFSVHDDGDRAATPGKQTIKEILFSKFKLPTFSSQVMSYLNGDDLGGTERKTILTS